MGLNYRPDIDGLRTIAVIPVVLYHVGFGPAGGFAGVDIFFVISGFLITTVIIREIDEGNFSIFNFWERRIRRLIPALLFMLTLTTAASVCFLIPKDLIEYARSAIYALFFLANIFFYQNIGYFNEAAELKPLLHTWSLGIEEQFYLFFPLLITVFYNRVSSNFWMIILACLVGMSFLLGILFSGTAAGFYLPITRVWEMGIGALLAANYRKFQLESKMLADAVGVFGCALIVAVFFLASPADPWPGLLALVSCIGAAAVIISGSNSSSITSRIFSQPPFVGIGRISYSLYLWHWPIIVFANYGQFEELTFWTKSLLLIGSFFMAYLSWRWVEEPVRRHRYCSSRISLYKYIFIIISLLLSVQLIIIYWNGLPGRVNVEKGQQWIASVSEEILQYKHCHQVTPERVSKRDLCVRGFDGVEPTFVLVGDSHANSLAPAVFDAADRLGLAGYQFTGAGFVPTLGRVRIGNITAASIADRRIDAFVDFLSNNPAVRTVYVTGWWHRYATGISYRGADAQWRDENCHSDLGKVCNEGSLHRSLTRLLTEFPDRRFIFLDDVPTGWALHPDSYFRASFRGLADNQNAILPIAIAEAQYMSYSPILESLALSQQNANFLPFITNRLCNQNGCSMLGEEGDLIFKDGDHLSEYGAMLLANDMFRIMSDTIMLNEK